MSAGGGFELFGMCFRHRGIGECAISCIMHHVELDKSSLTVSGPIYTSVPGTVVTDP